MPNNTPSKVAPYTSPASARGELLLLTEASRKKLDAVPLGEFVAMLAGGMTQVEIGKAVGCPQSAVSVWISNQRGEVANQLAAARRAAGEACLNRGLAELEAVKGSDSAAAVALARAFDAHWSRRAGLYNTQLHDRGTLLEVAVPPDQMPRFELRIVVAPAPQVPSGDTFDNGDDGAADLHDPDRDARGLI